MARIGWTKCGCCGNTEASISRTGTGTLSLSCHKCQFSGFAKAGTKAHRLILADMTPDEDAAPDPAPAAVKVQPKTAKPAPAADPIPAPKKPASVFSLGDL
jgi:hypothetical protein